MTGIKKCLLAGIALSFTACTQPFLALQDKYASPWITQPQGVIDVQKQYSFRFVDKYRISHRWLSGFNVSNCRYGINVDPPGAFPEILGDPPEPNTPLVERNGVLQGVGGNRGEIRFYSLRERVYGTNRDGEFEGYGAFCSQFFLASRNGIGLLIVKPDPAKGTDEWVEGAKSVKINGLNWLFKEIPPRDMTRDKKRLAQKIEIWTMKIPDTAYWLVLDFSADLKYSIQEHYDEHMGMLNLFHQIVASVKLEPLQPSVKVSGPNVQ